MGGGTVRECRGQRHAAGLGGTASGGSHPALKGRVAAASRLLAVVGLTSGPESGRRGVPGAPEGLLLGGRSGRDTSGDVHLLVGHVRLTAVLDNERGAAWEISRPRGIIEPQS